MLLVGSSATNVIGSASPDPDNSPKRRQLLRIFSQCHQQERLIQLRSQAWTNSFSENPVSCHAYYSKTVNPVTQGKTYGCKAVNPIPTLWPGFPEAVAFDPKGIGRGQAVSCNVCWTWSKWWWDPSGWLCFTLENHNVYIYNVYRYYSKVSVV